MTEKFSATVERWATQTEERMEAVFRRAVLTLLHDVEDRTPVVTGTLRASLMASTTGFFPLKKGKEAIQAASSGHDYTLVINNMELGEVLRANFIANYAKYVEDGSRGRPARKMVALAVQDWQGHVDRAVAQVRAS